MNHLMNEDDDDYGYGYGYDDDDYYCFHDDDYFHGDYHDGYHYNLFDSMNLVIRTWPFPWLVSYTYTDDFETIFSPEWVLEK